MRGIIQQFKREINSILSGLGVRTGQKTVIGLDIGSRYFRAVRFKEGARDIPLKDTLIDEIDNLKDLNGRLGIDSDEPVSVNFKSDNLLIMRTSVPVMPRAEIEEALRWELKEELQFDINKARLKFDILGETESEDGSKRIDLITVAYNEKEVEGKVVQLKNYGLNIQSVFPSGFALASYMSHFNIVSSSERVAVVEMGNIGTTIAIIENRKVCFVREVGVGGDTITEAMTGVLMSDKGKIEFSKKEAEKIKREEGIPEDLKILSMMRPVLEKVSNEIQRSLEYYEHKFGSGPIDKIILAGGGSRLKGLREYLSRETGLEVLDALPETACALGLSMINKDFLNMLPERFKSEKVKALKTISLRMVFIFIFLMFLFFYGLLFIKSINLKNELRVYKSHWAVMKDVRAIKEKMAVFGHAINVISKRGINAGGVMKELSNLVPTSLLLNDLIIEDKEPNVRLSGTILKQEQLSEFMSNLESSPVFEKVKLVYSERNGDYSGEALDFEILCNLTRD